jgi:hypothetical protein
MPTTVAERLKAIQDRIFESTSPPERATLLY